MRILAIHEYELKKGVDKKEFEGAVLKAIKSDKLDMPGLISRHFLKGYKAERKGKFAIIWIFESKKALEKLFGTKSKPKPGPRDFLKYEEMLKPFLDRKPNLITYTDYLELGRR